ncbi:MAG: hypothetical protein LAP39_17920 [Acidobacteriia bacterium]|nr:hypothetical protein [Terriglobia bacterium]
MRNQVAQHSERVYRGICRALVFCLLTASADAQSPPIKIVIQEGQGAINNIQQHRAKEPVVQVTHEDGEPVRAASVTFQLPDSGPGGVFADGSKLLTIQTDEKGSATGRGLRPNQVSGRFQIRVTASYRGATASAVISQINAEPAAAKGGGGKIFLIIALIGGAAAGGLVAAKGGNKSSSSGPVVSPITNPPTVLVPGTPSIQPPH